MATTYTVQDCYNTVCWVLLEDYNSGAGPGLSLGIVTQQEFLSIFSTVLLDFIQRTDIAYSIFTQQTNFNQSTYQNPNDLNTVKVCFLGGVYLDHSSLADLDDWQYNWQAQKGTPEYWHNDGLAPNTLELAATPNYTGAGYVIPVSPTAQPPFGVSGLFNGATIGRFTGTMSVSGTTGTWITGDLFDTNWNNYYPLPNITLNGTAWPLTSVTTTTVLVFEIAPGDGTYTWVVSIGNDGNLTMVGPTGVDAIAYTLSDPVPVVDDEACPALSYGILAKIFSTDGEAKDLQRAYYCQARYMEFCNILAIISGEMLGN